MEDLSSFFEKRMSGLLEISLDVDFDSTDGPPPYEGTTLQKTSIIPNKIMSSTVKIEQPFEFTLRAVKTKGLRDNTFDGRKVPGKQISVQVELDNIEKIQKGMECPGSQKVNPILRIQWCKQHADNQGTKSI